MSFRNFGHIKSLLHFDYPYFNEPGDGLGDEVGLETWSRENSNVKLYGSAIPNEGTQAPKFGYRCAYFGAGAVLGTNTSGMWNLNSSGKHEIEFFLYLKATGTPQYLFRLMDGDTAVLTLSIDDSAYIGLTCSAWNVSMTGTIAVATDGWRHVLLRISGSKAALYLDGEEYASQTLTEDVTLSVSQARIGYAESGSFCIDEFAFRDYARTGAPTIPTEPYSGKLDISKIGGYGTGAQGDVTISANTQINSYGKVNTVTDNHKFKVSSWSNGSYIASAGSEVMLQNVYNGLYCFAKVKSIAGTTVTLEQDISTENGYPFNLNTQLQVITVPNYKSLMVNAGCYVMPLTYDSSKGGGIVAFRCKGDCTINGAILTHGAGKERSDTIQMTHGQLVDHFLLTSGGNTFITCGGTFTAPSTARLGASWGGNGGSGNGAAGYGGNGGSTQQASGGNGGVGGGGGGAPSGNGGNGAKLNNSLAGGIAGANVLLVCDTLKLDKEALSTGGQTGESDINTTRIGAAGGGGTGFAYIACRKRG